MIAAVIAILFIVIVMFFYINYGFSTITHNQKKIMSAIIELQKKGSHE